MAVLCASHTPLMQDGVATDGVRAEVKRGFKALAERAEAFAPDMLIQFAPDHFNGFFYEVMPSFCVGINANSLGDWDTSEGPLHVMSDEALQLGETLLHDGLDVAVSYRMEVDHGFVQIWERMFGNFNRFPTIPIFINCAAPPLPTFKRARLLGEAVGRWALASGKRVLISASGGLSHDPPTPSIVTAPDEVKERLISGRHPSKEVQNARVERVLAAGARAATGTTEILPVDPAWDASFIEQLQSGNLEAFDNIPMTEIRAKAGRGGPEVLAWVAAFAALSVQGRYQADLLYYEAIQGWIAGMAMMFAEPKANSA
nr:3-carboxyethylcatechol 2,3-dioxygenase [Caballeronia sp. ATUFL_M2_KS44]